MKKTLLIVLLGIFSLGILGIALFYFLPVPEAVRSTAKQAQIERCFYNGGIGYSAIFSAGDIKHKSFYSSSGKKLCTVGGLTGVSVAEGPCKKSVCFSTYSE